jgi:ABC-type lipoprotein export system ATPase subunit
MNEPTAKPATKKRVIMLAGDAERRQLIEQNPRAALVSDTLPLRANLSVLENITVVLQFRTNTYIGEAENVGWKLLSAVERTDCAHRRDPDLNYEERFIAKLLRAVVLTPPIILIDRPAQLLPDTDYPFFLNRTLLALEGHFEQCWILDYAWNAPLYRSRG